MKRCLDNDAGGDRGWEARARRGWGTHVSKKLYLSDAASFLPTDDFPVPIIPTRKRLEPSRASLTSAATSSAAPSAEARAATRHRRAGRATGRARSAPVCARGAAARRAGMTAAWTTLMAISDGRVGAV